MLKDERIINSDIADFLDTARLGIRPPSLTMASHQLSEGVLSDILTGKEVPNPVFQILGYKKLPGDENDRYRLLISDGKWCYSTAMLKNELSGLISNDNLEKFTVVRVNNYECTALTPERKIIMFLDLEVISPGSDVGQCIGHPVPVEIPNVLPSPSNDSNLTSPTVPSEDSTPIVTRVTRQSARGIRIPLPPPRVKRQASGSGSRPKKLKTQAASSKEQTAPKIIGISKLHPYRKTWTIRARVTNKTPIREFCNPRREGKLFTFDLIDEKRGEVRAVLFNRSVDKFFDMTEVDKVYLISRGRMKVARKRYTSLRHYYEIHFTSKTTMVPCEGDFDSIPRLQFNFLPLDQVDETAADTAVDVIGVCRCYQDVEIALAKGTTETPKRDIILVDQHNAEVTVSLWADLAEDFEGSSFPVVALKGARITEENTITTFVATVMRIDPNIEEAIVLRKWFDKVHRKAESKSISHLSNSNVRMTTWKTLVQAKKATQGIVREPKYYKVKAIITSVKAENYMYPSCPFDECSRKVNKLSNGKYECTECKRQYDSFKWSFLLTISFADFSDNQWATCFGGRAESLLNKTAQELHFVKKSSEAAFNEIISKVIFKSYIFELCAKTEVVNNVCRLQTTVLGANPITPIDFSRKLLNDIKKMEEAWSYEEYRNPAGKKTARM